jgi:hypothetical protein
VSSTHIPVKPCVDSFPATLANVCPDRAIAAILNRLGYKTGQEMMGNASRVVGVRWYHEIPGFQKQDGLLTQEQAARELQVSNSGETTHTGTHFAGHACGRVCSVGDRAKGPGITGRPEASQCGSARP